MALLLMAFESWLNQELTKCYLFAGEAPPPYQDKLLELLLRESLAKKARHLPKYLHGSVLEAHNHPELELLTTVRHELIHDLPATNSIGEIDRLEQLDRTGLLISSGADDIEYLPHQRLCSFDLAWWAWIRVNGMVEAIANAAPQSDLLAVPHNFDLPRQWNISSPNSVEAAAADN
jgi:hypothetical protein